MYLRERETRDVEVGDLESPTSSSAVYSTSYSYADLLEGSPVGSRDSKLENESEMMADDLHKIISEKYPKRDMKIEVSEDGENGCEIYYPSPLEIATDFTTYEEMQAGTDGTQTAS